MEEAIPAKTSVDLANAKFLASLFRLGRIGYLFNQKIRPPGS